MKFKLSILLHYFLFRIRNDQKKSRSKLEKIQQKKLHRLRRFLAQSPFYKEMVHQNFKLKDFPIINKEVFIKNFDDINTAGIVKSEAMKVAMHTEQSRDFSASIKNITIGLSTGTSGNKGIFLANEKERAKWVAAMLHRVVGFSLKKRKVAFFLRANSKLYESSNSRILQFNFFDLLKAHAENFNRLVDLNADILIAQPSALVKIAKSYLSQQIKPGFTKVISVAEVLDQSDKQFLEKVFILKLDEVYQCTEGFLASSCSLGNLHFNEDFLIIEKEYLDDEKKRYHPIITDLYRHTQPVIRYKLDDILMEGEACNCGSSFDVIKQIEGRADDVIRLENSAGELVDIYPDFFSRAITMASDDISYYELIQTGKDVLELFFEQSKENQHLKMLITESIESLLSKFNIKQIKIKFSETQTLKNGAKLRRIRNEYFKAR